MKTADHKIIDPELVETRRLRMLETSPWCQPIQELSVSWSRPTPWTPLYPLQGGSPRLQGPLWPPLPGKTIKATVYYFTQNSVTSEHRLSFCNSIIKVYSEQLFANKMNNLKEIDKFLEIYNFHKKENTHQNHGSKQIQKFSTKYY